MKIFEIAYKILNIAHWIFTIVFLFTLFGGSYFIIKYFGPSTTILTLIISYCGMWICSGVEFDDGIDY